VLGVTEENERFEVLALEMGDRERADLGESGLASLADRGLDCEAGELAIMEGLAGRPATFRGFFPRAQTQRCQKQAQACRRVRKKEREVFSQALKEICDAPTESAARAAGFKVQASAVGPAVSFRRAGDRAGSGCAMDLLPVRSHLLDGAANDSSH